jgi:hypothetical protein
MMSLSVADRLWFHVRSLIPPERPPGNWILDTVVWLGLVHIQSLIGSVFVSATVRQTWCEVSGENGSVRSSLGYGLRRWRSFLWIGALKLLLGVLAAEAAAAILMLGAGAIADRIDPSFAPAGAAAIVLVLGFAGLIVAQWLSPCFSLSVAGGAIEDLRGMAALRQHGGPAPAWRPCAGVGLLPANDDGRFNSPGLRSSCLNLCCITYSVTSCGGDGC